MPELKRAHIEIEKLKNALLYAEAIINAIHEPLIVLHSDLRIRNANHVFYKTFRIRPNYAEQKLIFELANGQWNIPRLKILLENLTDAKPSFDDFELTHNFKKIGKKILLLSARKLNMTGEKGAIILLAINDVTEKKNYEERIENEKNILAENQRLQEISRQKDDFISMASHELRTPVTSIKAFAQLLERDFSEVGNAEAARMLARMNMQIIKLNNLIGDLLDVSRMEGGKLQYHLDFFNFNEMVDDVVREVQLTAKAHIINVNLVKTAPLYGDKDRIGQVLSNFLSNAIKYSPHAHIIKVTSKKDDRYINIFVKDYGIGIKKKSRKRFLKNFFA